MKEEMHIILWHSGNDICQSTMKAPRIVVITLISAAMGLSSPPQSLLIWKAGLHQISIIQTNIVYNQNSSTRRLDGVVCILDCMSHVATIFVCVAWCGWWCSNEIYALAVETTVFASPTVLVRQQDQENGHTERVFCFISCKPDN